MIVNKWLTILRILRMIVPLAPYVSQMGGLNHVYFMYDRASSPLRVADGRP